MTDGETLIFGIPVPSTDRAFLAVVVAHILVGIVCVVCGAAAMLSKKGESLHRLAGKTYYWGLAFIFLSVVVLSVMRWPHNNHLLFLGISSFSLAHTGRRLTRLQRPGWTRLHTICMGASYILLITAFYVDNGRHLPFWNHFSQLFFWIFPSAIGIPVIIYALLRHPLNRR